MSRPIRRVEGRAVPFGRANVDTDTIIPAAHLKTVTRTGLGRHAFAPLRQDPGNPFDDPDRRGAPILVAGANFGCGSSREHAVWALLDMGFEAVIASSFSDIFAGNAFKNGLVCAALDQASIDRLLGAAHGGPLVVDLERLEVIASDGAYPFDLDPYRRECLMSGLDEIGRTLRCEDTIRGHEDETPVPPPAFRRAVPARRGLETSGSRHARRPARRGRQAAPRLSN